MADKRAGEATRTMHHYGFGVRSDPTLKNVPDFQRGRADQMIVRAGRGVYVEVKGTTSDSFDMRNWTHEQRRWTFEEAIPNQNTAVWIWFYMGKGRINGKDSRRYTWLIPAPVFLWAHHQIADLQHTLPLIAKPGHKTAMQLWSLDAVSMFWQYALSWDRGHWVIPSDHEFAMKYLQPPVSLIEKEADTWLQTTMGVSYSELPLLVQPKQLASPKKKSRSTMQPQPSPIATPS